MKSQTSTEYGIVLGIMLIIVIIVLSTIYDFPSIVNKDESAFWQSREIGVLRIELTENQTLLLLQNNMRYPIEITEIYLADTNMSIVPKGIASGNVSVFESNVSLMADQLYIRINYTLGNASRVFAPDLYFKATRK